MSSEKRHELALVKRRHEELERQYQVSLRLKEQENRLKFEQSQLELEQLAESHKKQQIEMELKAFELEDISSEVSEKIAESNSTGVSQPISKVATDLTNDWETLLVHKHLLTLLVRQVCWPSLLYQFRQNRQLPHTSLMQQTQVIVITMSSLPLVTLQSIVMDIGLCLNWAVQAFLPLQAFFPSVSVPVNNMHSSAHVLPPPSAVPLQTMSSNITNGSFPIAQPEALPVPMLPAQPGSGFVSLSPAFAGGGFSSCGVNPTLVFFSAPNCHAAPVQTQHNLPFVPHTVSPNINDYYTSDANLWRLAATTPIVTHAQCCNAGNIFSNVTTVVPSCNNAAPYTSGGTVFFNTPPVHPQHVPHFVNHSDTGYQPVNEDYAPPSAYPNKGCSSDRPLSARELAELLMHSSKDHLPEWKLAQFDGNPLKWHEWFGQFKSTVDSAVLTDDTKLTYLKTLVTCKAKTANAEFSYSDVMYKDALATLQRKFGQRQAIAGARLDRLNTFPPLKTHKSESVISFTSAISGLVAVFKSLSFNDDLKSVNLLSQAVSKVPPNLKEAWSMHDVRHNWQRPTL